MKMTTPAPAAAAAPGPLYELLFAIPFHAAPDALLGAVLGSQLDMTMSYEPKMGVAPQALGFARLDYSSGLILVKGQDEGDWTIECRSYRPPAPERVHEWEVRTAVALQRIDPSVKMPRRL
jgi:hypothetical protein